MVVPNRLAGGGPWLDAGISSEIYDQILGEFMRLDENGDRMLNRKEFENISGLPGFLGMQHDDITHLFESVDVDSSGSISLKEFVAYMKTRKDHQPLPIQVTPQRLRLDQIMDSFGFELCQTDGGQKGVPGDGNCQFYSLSWDLYGTIHKNGEVRAAVVEYLRGPGRADFEVFYAPAHRQPPTFDGYLDLMAADKTWGDQLTLQAAASIFSCEIHVLTADRFSTTSGPPVLVVSPSQGSGYGKPKVIWISFAAQHYSPILPTNGAP